MRTIMFAVAIAAVAFTAAPMFGNPSARAEGVQTAQVDVQVGRDRDRDRDEHREHRDRDHDLTLGVGPGGVRVGHEHCRFVTTTVHREGRSITTRERRCD